MPGACSPFIYIYIFYNLYIYIYTSTARVSLRKYYFIPGCVGRGLDLDLRVRPAAAPATAASGNLGICPLGIEVEKQGVRTAWLITGQKCP